MGRKRGRDQGLGNVKFINLGSHLPQIYNEGKGGGEEREHWTKIGQGSQAGGRGLIGLFFFFFWSHVPPSMLPRALPELQGYPACLAWEAISSGPLDCDLCFPGLWAPEGPNDSAW